MKRTYWAWFLFAAYCTVMLWLLFGQRIGTTGNVDYWAQLQSQLVYRPFETIRRFLWVLRYSQDAAQLRHAIVNLGGNVIMFVPLGFLVPCIWEKTQRFGRHLLTMTLVILAVELLQLFTLLGSCDVDDLLLNLAGTSLGFFIWKLAACLGKNRDKE